MNKTICFLLGLLCLQTLAAKAEVRLAVTVDDLPVHGDLPKGTTRLSIARGMIETLRRHHVPKVYGFLNAITIADNPDHLQILREWRAAGFPLANHTYSHMDLSTHDVSEYIADFQRDEPVLKELSAGDEYRYFRFPYLSEGDTLDKRNRIRSFLQENKYQIAQVTVDFDDWAWTSPYARCVEREEEESIAELRDSYLRMSIVYLDQARKLADRLFHRDIKHVLLLHLGAFDAVMLDQLLSAYENQGVKFITLDEALKDEIYDRDSGYVSANGQSLLGQFMSVENLPIPEVEPVPEEWLAGLCSG
jgi:peptidoglycan/xylan/chitin deacetylase (PgdA/CDA1 family)